MTRQHREDYYASSGCVQDMMDAMFSAKNIKDSWRLESRIKIFEEELEQLPLDGLDERSEDYFRVFYTGRINEFKQRYKELTGKEYEECQE